MSIFSFFSTEKFPYPEYLTLLDQKEIDPKEFRDLDIYKEAVENLAESQSDFIFPNSNGFHAAVVLGAIVRHAKKRFRIYDDNLKGDISSEFDAYKEFLPALVKHVESGRNLQIVLREDNERDSPIYKIVKDLHTKYKALICVRKASPSFRQLVKDTFDKDVNFAVGDDVSFRLEEYVDDERGRKAICSFNQPSYAEKLNKIFDKEFADCETVV
jgi:hypothetical protein